MRIVHPVRDSGNQVSPVSHLGAYIARLQSVTSPRKMERDVSDNFQCDRGSEPFLGQLCHLNRATSSVITKCSARLVLAASVRCTRCGTSSRSAPKR